MKNKLFESYMKQASMYINEDEDMQEDEIDMDETDTDGDFEEEPEEDEIEDEEDSDDEEELELDLSNPVCPSCGSKLIPVGGIDVNDIDEENAEDGEADAIELLQGLGYVVYKPTEDDLSDEDLSDDDDDMDFDDESDDFDDESDDFDEDEEDEF